MLSIRTCGKSLCSTSVVLFWGRTGCVLTTGEHAQQGSDAAHAHMSDVAGVLEQRWYLPLQLLRSIELGFLR